jgi:hypothetical protein
LILQKAFSLHTQVDGVAIPPSLLNTSGFDASNDAPDIYIFLPAAAATAADTRQNTAINSQDSHVAAAAAAAAKAAEYGYAGLRSEYLKLTGAVPALPDEAFGTWFSWCECDRRAFITITPLTIASSSCFCLWMCSDSLVLSLVALARCYHFVAGCCGCAGCASGPGACTLLAH